MPNMQTARLEALNAAGGRRQEDAPGVVGTVRGTRRERREQPVVGRSARFVVSIFGFWTLAAAPVGAVLYPNKAVPIGSAASVVAIGDLNGDGRPDIAVATRAAGASANDRCLLLFRQTESGTLAAPVRYSTGVEAAGIALGDLNGDRRLDVAVCGGNRVVVLQQSSTGSLEPPRWSVTGEGADSVAIGDLNGDGRADLAVSHSDEPQVSVLYQTPSGGLTQPRRYPVADAGSNELAIADLTGDGLADLLFMRGRSGRASLSLMPQDPATHRLGPAFRYGWGEDRPSHGIAVADLNGDQRLDVAMTWGGARPECGLGIFHQPSGGGLLPAVPYGTPDGPESIKTADMNSDGRADLVVAHGGGQSLSTYLQLPDGTLRRPKLDPLPFAGPYHPQGLALGDVNSDGWTDVALADDTNGLVLLLNAGGRDLTPPETRFVGVQPGVTRETSLTLRVAGSDDRTPAGELQYRWNLDGGAWSAFAAGPLITLPGLAEGWHTATVAARDAGGNVDPTPLSHPFVVDRTPPTGLVLTGVGAATTGNGVSVSADAEDNLTAIEDLTFAWRVDGGPWSDFSYAWRITLSGLFEGPHVLEARAGDPAGNASPPASIRFTVDRTPPTTRVNSVTRDLAAGKATAAFSATDALLPDGLRFSWRVDGGAWSTFAAVTQAQLTGLSPGPHTFEVRARDAAGNIDPTPAVQGF
jgi:hypothetical protein